MTRPRTKRGVPVGKERQYLVIVFPPPTSLDPKHMVALEFGKNKRKTPFATRVAADRKAKALRAKYPSNKGWRVKVGWWEFTK